MSNLDVGLVGNCCVAALVDQSATVVWLCLPRFDGDPVFHSLLGGTKGDRLHDGAFSIELQDQVGNSQIYVPNTGILKTTLEGVHGAVEITDHMPRFMWHGRSFRPQMMVRHVKAIRGSPRICVRVRPRFDHGATAPEVTRGSNHVRYVGPKFAIRLTTDAPIDYVLSESFFNLREPISLIIGADETLENGVAETARQYEEMTTAYWREWVHRLAVPFEWQEAVIRAAITLKLCTYEPTGGIVAAITTSIPEAPHSQRNWDYRLCWVRDAYFVIRALNSLSAMRTMENYLNWLMNVVAAAKGGHIQPVLGVGLEANLAEQCLTTLPGYRNMGPVRIGNQAHEHFQHDSYGHVVLGATQAFLDSRLLHQPGRSDFDLLEKVGEQAVKLYDQPDAGMWELRSRARVHTSSSVLCWAAADRLARIARHLAITDRATYWRSAADRMRETILARSWSTRRQAFVESFEGEHLDASVLLMTQVGFIDPSDPRMVTTVEQLDKALARGPFMMRYESADDFGLPETAFNFCAFWRVDALARMGRREEARAHFEALLACRNHLGLLSEDTDPRTGELWGNFPQTYSMVGIINGAVALSQPWETAI